MAFVQTLLFFFAQPTLDNQQARPPRGKQQQQQRQLYHQHQLAAGLLQASSQSLGHETLPKIESAMAAAPSGVTTMSYSHQHLADIERLVDLSAVTSAEGLCSATLRALPEHAAMFEVELMPLAPFNLRVVETFVARYRERVDMQRTSRPMSWWLKQTSALSHPACYVVHHRPQREQAGQGQQQGQVVGLLLLDVGMPLVLDLGVLHLPEFEPLIRQSLALLFNVLHSAVVRAFPSSVYEYARHPGGVVRVNMSPEDTRLRRILTIEGQYLLDFARRRDPLAHEVGARDTYEASFRHTALFSLLRAYYVEEHAIRCTVLAQYDPSDRKLVCDVPKPDNVYSSLERAKQLRQACDTFFGMPRRRSSKPVSELRFTFCFLDQAGNRLQCFRGGKDIESKVVHAPGTWLLQITHLQTTPLYRHSPVLLKVIVGYPISLPDRDILLPICIATRRFEVTAEKSGRTNKHLFRPCSASEGTKAGFAADELTRYGISIDRHMFDESCRRNSRDPDDVRRNLSEFMRRQMQRRD
eukprot:m.188170 g.188170  ORF g.188170 m.188170 type:complete len:526 (-) comp18178_c1_seq1:393-1970(-)